MPDFQSHLIFPTHAVPDAGPLPPGSERLQIESADGKRLHGVHIPPSGAGEGDGTLILGFGGNAWNADAMALYLHGLFPDHEVIAFHYRGYPPSSGEPSTKALFADSLTIVDYAQKERTHKVIAISFSIGSGVAAYVARHRPVTGLFLITPFDSLKALAREHFPWAPTGLLLRHHMPIVDLVQGQQTPTALIAAGRDTIVPARRSEPLRSAVPNLIVSRIIADAGHNDLYSNPAFAAAMHEAVARFEVVAPQQSPHLS